MSKADFSYLTTAQKNQLKELIKNNPTATYDTLADQVAEAGIKSKTGDFFSKSHISRFAVQEAGIVRRKSARLQNALNGSSDKEAFREAREYISDSNLPKEKKLEILDLLL